MASLAAAVTTLPAAQPRWREEVFSPAMAAVGEVLPLHQQAWCSWQVSRDCS